MRVNMMQKIKTIITNTGVIAPAIDCVLINGAYFLKEVDAVLVEKDWYVKGDRRIFFDDVDSSYKLRGSKQLVFGIIGMKEGSYVYGRFAVQDHSPIRVHLNYYLGTYEINTFVPNAKVLEMIPDLVEFPDERIWRQCANIPKEDAHFMALQESFIKPGKYNYSIEQMYSSGPHLKAFMDFPKVYPDLALNSSEVAEFGEFTFGLEFETCAGVIPEQQCFELGLIPLRDGSIEGIEYATVPMAGEEGFKLLHEQLRVLSEKTRFNKECSVHVHLGGFPIDKTKIFKLYNILYNIQSSVFDILPRLATRTAEYKAKRKNYTNPLPKFSSFEQLYKNYSGGALNFEDDLTKAHPGDPNDRQKWNMEYRYMWANLLNLMFKPAGKTVEFRIHGPSTNYQKIVYWMFLCNAILKYASTTTDSIATLVSKASSGGILEYIFNKVYSKDLAEKMISYCILRKFMRRYSECEYNDTWGRIDQEEDSKITFLHNLLINE